MLKTETLKVLGGRLPRALSTSSLILVIILVVVFVCAVLYVAATIMHKIVKEKEIGETAVFTLISALGFFVAFHVLSLICCLFTGFFLEDLVLKNNKVIEMQIDTESEAFKSTVGTTENLNRLIANFPNKEQKHLEYEIKNKGDGYYFSTLIERDFFEKPPSISEMKGEMEDSLTKYLQRMNLYAPDIKVPELDNKRASEYQCVLDDDLRDLGSCECDEGQPKNNENSVDGAKEPSCECGSKTE